MMDPTAHLSERINACFGAPHDSRVLTWLDAGLRPYLLAVLASVNRRGPDVIEDAYQDAFIEYIRIFRAGRRPEINYEAYFVAIAKNALYDLKRDIRRLVAMDDVLETEFDLPPNDERARTEARILVWQTLSKLDLPCESLLHRHYLDGFDIEALSAEDRVTSELIRVRLFRCRQKLKQLLEGAR